MITKAGYLIPFSLLKVPTVTLSSFVNSQLGVHRIVFFVILPDTGFAGSLKKSGPDNLLV